MLDSYDTYLKAITYSNQNNRCPFKLKDLYDLAFWNSHLRSERSTLGREFKRLYSDKFIRLNKTKKNQQLYKIK